MSHPNSDTFDPSNHCGRPECPCTHTECEKGWQWTSRKNHRGESYEAVLACLICDTDRHAVQIQADTRVELQKALRARGVNARKDARKRSAAEETRTI